MTLQFYRILALYSPSYYLTKITYNVSSTTMHRVKQYDHQRGTVTIQGACDRDPKVIDIASLPPLRYEVGLCYEFWGSTNGNEPQGMEGEGTFRAIFCRALPRTSFDLAMRIEKIISEI